MTTLLIDKDENLVYKISYQRATNCVTEETIWFTYLSFYRVRKSLQI